MGDSVKFDDLRGEYRQLWLTAYPTTHMQSASTATSKKILSNQERYKEVEAALGVPWYFVGVIHAMESGCKFGTHLHNGDPLSARTRLVPRGRPRGGNPPFTWLESAIDALTIKGLQNITEWSVERMCYELERYNGWGYRKYHKSTLSPYLWSGTVHYHRGKYVADGKWSSTAVSGQTGAACLLKKMSELEPSIVLGFDVDIPLPERPQTVPDFPKAEEEPVVEDAVPVPSAEAPVAIAPATFPKAEEPRVQEAAQKSRTITGALVAAVGTVASYADTTMKVLLDAASQVIEWSPINSLFMTAGMNMRGLGFSMAVGGLALVISRRINAAVKGKEG